MVRISRFGCCSLILIAAACGKVAPEPGNDMDAPPSSGDAPPASGDAAVDGPPVPTEEHTLTVTREGTGAGSVTSTAASHGDVAGIQCGVDCRETYPAGTTVTLRATTAAGSTFIGWSGAGASCTGTECTVTVDAEVTVTATFNLNQCTPSTTTCDNPTGELIVCDASGNATSTSCALGCHPTIERCNDLLPSNGMASELDAAANAPDIVLGDGAVIDTSNGTVTVNNEAVTIPSAVIEQTGGPSIRVFRVKSLLLNDATVTGTRALAIVSHGDITMRGTLLVNAVGTRGAAGAAGSCATGPAGLGNNGGAAGDSSILFTGGSGGGFATRGEAGGGDGWGTPGAPASASVSNLTLSPLRGGCPGGSNQDNGGAVRAVGGGAGGAVQLVSRVAIHIVQNGADVGRIHVGGGGGGPGCTGASCVGGTGGGSGGGILLEAPVVTVSGDGVLLASNGGGGGGACSSAGSDSQLSTSAATGSCGAGNGSTGSGSATSGATPEEPPVGAFSGGAGGGGGRGVVRVNNATGSFSPANGARISASVSSGMAGRR